MTIQETIKADMKKAMLAKDNTKRDLLRVVLGEFTRVSKEVDDSKAQGIIKKMKENAEEVNNPEEAAILASYLPQLMNETEAETAISEIIKAKGFSGMKDMGATMAAIKEAHGAAIDGRAASGIVKKLLS